MTAARSCEYAHVASNRAPVRTPTALLALAAICAGALIVGAETQGDVRVVAHIVAGAVLFGLAYAVVALLLAFFARRPRKRSRAR